MSSGDSDWDIIDGTPESKTISKSFSRWRSSKKPQDNDEDSDDDNESPVAVPESDDDDDESPVAVPESDDDKSDGAVVDTDVSKKIIRDSESEDDDRSRREEEEEEVSDEDEGDDEDFSEGEAENSATSEEDNSATSEEEDEQSPKMFKNRKKRAAIILSSDSEDEPKTASEINSSREDDTEESEEPKKKGFLGDSRDSLENEDQKSSYFEDKPKTASGISSSRDDGTEEPKEKGFLGDSRDSLENEDRKSSSADVLDPEVSKEKQGTETSQSFDGNDSENEATIVFEKKIDSQAKKEKVVSESEIVKERDVIVLSDSDSDSHVTPPPSVVVEAVEKKGKSYTRVQIQDLEGRVRRQENLIEKNQRLLKYSHNLPNDGEKLKSFISKKIAELEQLKSELSYARNNQSSEDKEDQEKISTLKKKLALLRGQYSTLRPERLPDGGAQLRSQIAQAQFELSKLQKNEEDLKTNTVWQQMKDGLKDAFVSGPKDSNLWAQGPAVNQLYGGRMNNDRKLEVVSVTQDAIKRLHDSLKTMPLEADEEDDPVSLKSKVKLFPHQRQGLAWLLWRETQKPPGGILADDMGLGKTLTMISLILKHKELEAAAKHEDGSKDEDWLNKGQKGLIRSKGTLVICPASLLSQWENEAANRVKSGVLRVLVYHGNNRGRSARSLSGYDLVITTYGTILSEVKGVLNEDDKKGGNKLEELGAVDLDKMKIVGRNVQLLSVAWERIILDEAHQIRNPRSQTAQAVCRLRAGRRWCVTGTPIQNKELDMYSLIRFLRCSPFDEHRVWKQWVENKTPQGQTRMNTIVKSLLLRRTKEQQSNITGKAIIELPEKTVVEHNIKLGEEEQKVYDQVFSLSQNAMINYMNKYKEEGDDTDMDDKPKRPVSNPYSYKNPNSAAAAAGYSKEGEVKAHHLLVLLLRLRQVCSHPGLIQSMLEEESKAVDGIEDEDGEDIDLLSRLADMSITSAPSEKGEPEELKSVLNKSNPVFRLDTPSSKIKTVIEALEVLRSNGKYEKAVIVSQWTSMLDIVELFVKALGMKCAAINGKIPVKGRGDIVDDFNKKGRGAQVLLLSLGAGGVGLNLVGGNHLFLLDMHWNPQLETQACDRIYRVGQDKEVTIHKFLCEDTVESRILLLQKKKLRLADGVLTGAKRSGVNKLTLDDLKMLFNVQ